MPAPRPAISAILITYNEEERLGRALDSIRWVDEIVIVDGGSTDGTERIARRYTDRFVVRRDWAGFGLQKQRAFELATGEWVLSIDADEVVAPELRIAIETAVARPGDNVGFQLVRHSYYLAHWFGRSGWRRDWILRLFRRDRARFNHSTVHERARVDGPVGRLDGALLHYTHLDIDHQVRKFNRYSTDIARSRYARGRRSGAVMPVVRGAARFFADYVIRGGFLDGRAGLISAGVTASYGFLKYAKLWELGLREEEPGSAPDTTAEGEDASAGVAVAERDVEGA